jgi:sulfite oxidase
MVEALRTVAGTGVGVQAPIAAPDPKRALVVPGLAGAGVLGLAIVAFIAVRGGPGSERDQPRDGVKPDDELNGAALTADHGFPLRTVVPGWIGARSVKWLGRITLCAEPSGNYFQRRAYRVQREVNPRDPRDVAAGVALSVVPINAVVLHPTSGQVVPAGPVRVHGWAMGEAGQAVRSVEVSADGGAHWIAAALAPGESAWTWTLWEAAVQLAPGAHTIVARATDAAGTVQPATLRETWNVKGYNNNAWHRVAVRAE